MNIRPVLPTLLLVLSCTFSVRAAPGSVKPSTPVPIPSAEQILKTLKPEHPRLLASTADFAALKQRIQSDELLKKWHAELRANGDRIITQSPSKYEIPDGLRLLATSRRVLQRTYTLGLLYRLDGDRRYQERLWQELNAAANFPDWNPRHFLDTAEMTHAFAIAYDWLYDAWTEAQRTTLRTAMVEKGIKLGLQVHVEGRWWAKAHHNWNQVCNGGIGMGALALADVEPKLAGQFLSAALKSIQLAMVEYGPDGAWAEGPGYWSYATTYNVTLLAALQTALGTDFGLTGIQGFSEAGSFPIYASGPSGRSFNYADSHEGVIRDPVLFWLARKFNHPEYAWYQRQVARAHPLDLLWYDAALARPPATSPPLDKYYRHAEVVTLRSAWDDPNALFVGLKAGDNKANHSHLDLGSFILEALGTRWAVDLGSDNYNLPAYFGNQRWNYYRLRAESHNTLLINPGKAPDQNPRAVAPIVKFVTTPERAVAVADLTRAYSGQANRVERGLALLDRRQVLVQDEVQADQPAELWWFFCTPATVEINDAGTVAMLRQGTARLEARLVSPANATFKVMPAEPLPSSPNPPRQASNSRYRKLAIHIEDAKSLRLAVLLTPLKEGEANSIPPPQLKPLEEW